MRRVRGATGWARFVIRSTHLNCECIRLHAVSEAHKRAVAAFRAPPEPLRVRLQSSEDDELLLQGSVPQPSDWLRAWQCAKNPSSWCAAAQRASTEHFIAHNRARAVGRKAFKAMISCMGEVLRREKRRWLSEATSIFLTFGDKEGRKLLRFKCDVPSCFDAEGGDGRTLLPYGARHGIVGCMPTAAGKAMSEYEGDYAERTADDVATLLRRMCTPADGSVEEDVYAGVLLKVRGVCVDGQLLKTAQVMQEGKFPNIVIIMRDPAHIIRISCRDPLHGAEAFGEQYDRLFHKRHAVLKDFQNSHVWKEQLMACQRQILAEGGAWAAASSRACAICSMCSPASSRSSHRVGGMCASCGPWR